MTITLTKIFIFSTIQLADDIMIQEITAAGVYREIGQAFVVLLPVKSVGVMGDQRTYVTIILVILILFYNGIVVLDDRTDLPCLQYSLSNSPYTYHIYHSCTSVCRL